MYIYEKTDKTNWFLSICFMAINVQLHVTNQKSKKNDRRGKKNKFNYVPPFDISLCLLHVEGEDGQERGSHQRSESGQDSIGITSRCGSWGLNLSQCCAHGGSGNKGCASYRLHLHLKNKNWRREEQETREMRIINEFLAFVSSALRIRTGWWWAFIRVVCLFWESKS